ncbi:MAG: 8-amino-7-oxononanoate synthase [Muribaculaceae bacterium]|nr:8-amino-7-oxononanoate synthase [Muribaculaceae bacterium]
MPSINEILDSLASENRLRRIPHSQPEGILDLASNDYMGLGQRHQDFTEEFFRRFPDAGFSSSASRLLSIRQDYHKSLEEYLESLYGKPVLLFNSGYHANVGCIGALTLPSTLFLCDKLIHASVVDGLRIASSVFKRFPHNDMVKLRRLLEKEAPCYERVIVVVESIYSMDGDEAPLAELVSLKREFPNVMLYLDEAHAFGVRGRMGLGMAEELSLISEFDLIIGTLGKAAASSGAFVVCSDEVKNLLINLARPFIFSTALPPVNAAWSQLMIEKLTAMKEQRQYLRELSEWFRKQLKEATGDVTVSTSQIIPYLTRNAERAIEIAERLREHSIVALPIRRPTVPPGGERIRFSLSCAMKRDDLYNLFNILRTL